MGEIMIRKFIKLLICLILLVSFTLGITVSAAEIKEGIITIDTVSAYLGESVIIRLNMSENPGIMAMTVSVNYDSDALEFEKYHEGFLSDYKVVDHPDKNLLRVVSLEKNSVFENGILLSLQFKVKQNATKGLKNITLTYNRGDFADFDLNRISPKIVSGGINVKYRPSDCPHDDYNDWTVVKEPTCTEEGIKQRTCECGNVDTSVISPKGHDFEKEWTVDVPATVNSNGSMSRHCKICNASTDVLTFEYEDAKNENIPTQEGEKVPPSQFTEEQIEIQHPEIKDDKFEKLGVFGEILKFFDSINDISPIILTSIIVLIILII